MLRGALVVVSVCVLGTLVGCSDDDPSGTGSGDSDADGQGGVVPGAGSSGGSGGSGGNGGNGSSGGGTPGTPWSLEPRSGIATYYDATGAGACSFDAGGDLHVVALGTPLYDDAALCGACLEVTGPNGSTKVRVVDRCPECPAEHLDLSREAFAEIAEMRQGRVDITFRFVECETSSNLRYRFKDGSSRWWTGIQVQNHRLPIAKLEVRKDGSWVDVPRLHYNYFVLEDGVGPQPDGLSVRVTAVDGQVLEDQLPPVGDAELDTKLHDGNAQFE